jgi:hypothetical protein
MESKEVESNREWLGNFWDELKSGVWHATTIENLSKILDDQFIRPNGDRTDNRWNGYCSSEGWISLFDFESSLKKDGIPEDEILDEFCTKTPSGFLSPRTDGKKDGCSIWIKIQTNKLPNGIVDNEEGCLKMKKTNFIPKVEICCKEPIPVKSFDCIIMVHFDKPRSFRRIDMFQNVLGQIKNF